jgi:hypothetical protein
VRKLQGGDVDAFAFRPRPAPAARVHQAMSAVLAATVPTGDGWIHQLKHDGFRIIGHKDGDHVRLWSRNGRDWSVEFVAITAAVMALPFARIVIDGEAVAHCPGSAPRTLWRRYSVPLCLRPPARRARRSPQRVGTWSCISLNLGARKWGRVFWIVKQFHYFSGRDPGGGCEGVS